MEPITREEQIMASGSTYEIPEPVTRQEKFLRAIIDALNPTASPQQVGEAMSEYVQSHPEFWGSIPEGTITMNMLADGVPEQIRDDTMQAVSDEELSSMFTSILGS